MLLNTWLCDHQIIQESSSLIHFTHLKFNRKFTFQCNLVYKTDVGLEWVARCNMYTEQ